MLQPRQMYDVNRKPSGDVDEGAQDPDITITSTHSVDVTSFVRNIIHAYCVGAEKLGLSRAAHVKQIL